MRAFAATVHFPVVAADRAVAGAALYRDRRVVLLAAVDAVLESVVSIHAVELCRRLVVLARPARAAVEADVAPPSFALIIQRGSSGLIQR